MRRYKSGFPVRILALFAILAASGCQLNEVECGQQCADFWLDGGKVPDPCSLPENKTCLVSRRIGEPDSLTRSRPVILAIHGYTASTFEWEEFREFAEDRTDTALVSLVLMGGHGLNIDEFQSSSWRDWKKPIMEEYDSLVSKGYENISFACASTGCALLMEDIRKWDSRRQSPKWVFMVDPIVVPSEKLLALAHIVGPMVGNSPNPGSDSENARWYVNRPQETLRQLYQVINLVKNNLEDGFQLPKGTRAKVYKSKKDGSADPVGALLIYKGLRNSGGSHIEVEMEDSHLHVMTRLRFRDPAASHADTLLQSVIFNEMVRRVNASAKI